MPSKIDCLIIGGGVAGAVAASVLAKNNRKVMLVNKTGGATGQSSGAIDVAYSNCDEFKSSNYLEASRLTAKQNHYHPYAKIPKESLGFIEDALLELKSLASEVELTGSQNSSNLIVATQFGTLKPTAMVQRTQAFDFRSLRQGDCVLVMGFSGLPSFDAKIVGQNLKWAVKTFLNLDIRVETKDCDICSQYGNWNSPMEMAQEVDRDFGIQLQASIRSALFGQSKKYAACLIPAVLGRVFYREARGWVNQEGLPLVYELLALPHSMPGIRLQDALSLGLKSLPVEIIQGEAIGSKTVNEGIASVSIKTIDEEKFDIEPTNVILCSGRFFAGGFERSGYRREKIFDLPLWHKNQMIENTHVAMLTDSRVSNTQPIFNCGLFVDEYFRPLNKEMRVFAQNLFAAGSSLGGYDALGEGASLGIAAFTGYVSAFHTLNRKKI